jgi:hypothetical protein
MELIERRLVEMAGWKMAWLKLMGVQLSSAVLTSPVSRRAEVEPRVKLMLTGR